MRSEDGTVEAELRHQVEQLELWKQLAWCNIIFTLLLASWMIWGSFKSENAVHGEMRVHRVVVIDDANKERIVIAAPLKELPVVNGKTSKRRVGVSAAIQFKEADGTERGGIALEDDGSFMFGIDDERGRERAHLFYIPNRGSAVYLQAPGAKTVSLADPPANAGQPGLQIVSSDRAITKQWP
ncbi:hypothetical protein [Terriglobus roseus]|uniref:Uncharacterized protein n=1 Tax=Terriglobus roseus TaxID=392734 RepID=A0A1G7HKV0_9BACT|nr:hypothetical protein [Terriglobus roseus]SDF01075.1 hypothetical protein SAMN05444167_1119 [Terriglobus roseus]